VPFIFGEGVLFIGYKAAWLHKPISKQNRILVLLQKAIYVCSWRPENMD
jgi:hypothetical protein